MNLATRRLALIAATAPVAVALLVAPRWEKAPTTSRSAPPLRAATRSIGEVAFLPDRDESQSGVRYGYGHGAFSVGITPNAAVFGQRSRTSSKEEPRFATFRMDVIGGDANAELRGENPCAWRTNVYHGDDASAWREGVPNYARVRSRGALPGVDLVYRAEGRRVAFDFEVAPGADPSRIGVAFAVGDDRTPAVSIAADGALVVSSSDESMRFGAPVVYQDTAAGRTPVRGAYALRAGENGRTDVAFEVADYDRSRTLVIDPPSLGSAVTLGGDGNDNAIAAALGKNGQSYLVGITTAPFFATNNFLGGTTGGQYDGFVAQIDDAGAVLANAVFGGSATDYAYDVAVEAVSGDLFVAGAAFVTTGPSSVAFPTTAGAYAGPGGASTRGFVLRMTPALTLVASAAMTFERGMMFHGVSAANGRVAVSCETPSRNLPTSALSAHPTYPVAAFGGPVAAALVLSDDLSTPLAATYVGEENGRAYDCMYKDNGNLVVCGLTTGATLPVVNAPQATAGGGTDGWWAEYDADLKTVQVCTYVGGLGFDLLQKLAKPTNSAALASFAGDVFACGACSAAPTIALTTGSFHGGNDILVCAIRPNAAPLVTCIGGGGNELPTAMVFVDSGFLTLGYTDSFGDYTLIPDLGPGGGESDVCLNAFNVTGTTLTPDADFNGFRWGGPGGDPSGGLAVRPRSSGVPGKTGAKSSPKLASAQTIDDVIDMFFGSSTDHDPGNSMNGDQHKVAVFVPTKCKDPADPRNPHVASVTKLNAKPGFFDVLVRFYAGDENSDTMKQFDLYDLDDGTVAVTVPFERGRGSPYYAILRLRAFPGPEHKLRIVAETTDGCLSQSVPFKSFLPDPVVTKFAQSKSVVAVTVKKPNPAAMSFDFSGTGFLAANGVDAAVVGGTAAGLVVSVRPGKAPKPRTTFDVSGRIDIPAGVKRGTLTFSNAGLPFSLAFNLKMTINGRTKSVKFTLKRPK